MADERLHVTGHDIDHVLAIIEDQEADAVLEVAGDGSERWAQAGGLRLGRTGKVRSCGWRVNSVAVERTFARLRGKQVRRISPESFVISSTFLHPRAFALAGSPFASRPKTRISLPK